MTGDDEQDAGADAEKEAENSPLSEDEDENSLEAELNWEFLAKSWPLEERPSKLQEKKYVAKLPTEKIRSYFKLWKEGQKAAKSEDGQCRDTQPKEVKFREGSDDGFSKLHPARFCRFPLDDPTEWWHKTPTVRREMYLSMPLDFYGLENSISDVTIKKAHKKSEILQLKHYLSENVSVASRSQKETRTHTTGGGVSTTLEYNWYAPTNLSQAKEAVFNFASLNFLLFPFDPTGLTLLRLLNRYEWFAVARSEKARVELITSFFNLVLKKVANAALNHKCVPSHKQQEEWLKEILARNNLSTTIPEGQNFQSSYNNSDFNPNNKYSWNQGNRANSNSSKTSANNPQQQSSRPKKYPHHNGVGLCIDFNKPGGNSCRRPPAKDKDNNDGCKDGSAFYLHQCSQWIRNKQTWCNRNHPRKDCRYFK